VKIGPAFRVALSRGGVGEVVDPAALRFTGHGSLPRRTRLVPTVAVVRVAVVAVLAVRVAVGRLVIFGDEHRRQVAQAILAFHAREMAAVADEFVRDLVDDEGRVILRGQRFEGVPQQGALLIRLADAERDARDDVIAVAVATLGKLFVQEAGILIEDLDPGVIAELLPEVLGKLGVQFKKNQAGFRIHPPGDFPGMAAFAGAIFDDHARDTEVHFGGHPPDQGRGAGYHRSDLERALEESLKEDGTHSGPEK
jgi:hypothetical protein